LTLFTFDIDTFHIWRAHWTISCA